VATASVLVASIWNGVVRAATGELLNAISTYSVALVKSPMQSDAASAAVSVRVSPTASLMPFVGAHGWTIDRLAVPVFPSLVAVIVTVPAAIPVTRPEVDTVAFVASEVVHVIARPVTTAPDASVRFAVICCVAPTLTVDPIGPTATNATGVVGDGLIV